MMLTTLLMLAPLTVIVEDVRSTDGDLYVTVQTESEFMQERGTAGSIEEPEKGSMTLEYDVAPGEYAVSVWHDENDNAVFDREDNGWPLDGWAMSGQAAPEFSKAKIVVPESGLTLRVQMTYPE